MTKQKEEQQKQVEQSFVDTLLADGAVVIEAKTPEGISEMIDSIPADCSYRAGAVGYRPDTGDYAIRVILTNN